MTAPWHIAAYQAKLMHSGHQIKYQLIRTGEAPWGRTGGRAGDQK